MSTKRTEMQQPVGDQSFEVAGGAAEVVGLGLDGLAHVGPLAVLVGALALVMAPVLWLRRRCSRS
ncbi:MAG TPA: hypothetical protein VHN36_04120 [Ilumatobacteraceae bacterium]|nr:hypothetical protein [Ilumatobacteraceae bacterium]